MKEIFLKDRTKKDWAGQWATNDHYSILLTETTKVFKADGSVLCVVLKKTFDEDFVKKSIEAYGEINKTIPVSPHGFLEWCKVYPLSTLGFIEPYQYNQKKLPSRASEWNAREPEKWKIAQGLAKIVWDKYKNAEPTRSGFQEQVAKNADQKFVIPETGFSTITMGKNFPREYHSDTGCLVGGSTVFSVTQIKKWRGAFLVWPDFGVAAELLGGDLVIFDSMEFHGNTPIQYLEPGAERWVNSYYFRELLK